MQRFHFLSSFVILGLCISNCMAQTPPPSSRAVDTSGPSPEQLANEIAKKNAESDKYLLNEAGKTESDKQPPQLVTDTTATPAGQAKAPAKVQPPASTSSINSGSGNDYEGFGTGKPPAQGQPSGSGSTNSNKDSSNWNLGY